MNPTAIDQGICPAHSGLMMELQQHQAALVKGDERMERIEVSLKAIELMLTGRPSWVVCVIFALLTGALGTTLTMLLTGIASRPDVANVAKAALTGVGS